MAMRVALVEDDAHVGQLMGLWLDEADYHYQLFTSGSDFQRTATRESFDLVILDWMLPDTTGDQLLVWLREHLDWRVPVVFVTARDSEEDIVQGLSLGADDYMTKPVRRNELLARIAAVTRRVQGTAQTRGSIHMPPYDIHVDTRMVMVNGAAVELTQKEYELVLFLFRNAGRLLSRGHILESVWGQRSDLPTRTVDTHMSRIRTKLALGVDNAWRLSAIYNQGYRLEPPEEMERNTAVRNINENRDA
jgi:DNA-binding response OmpR family regulator